MDQYWLLTTQFLTSLPYDKKEKNNLRPNKVHLAEPNIALSSTSIKSTQVNLGHHYLDFDVKTDKIKK